MAARAETTGAVSAEQRAAIEAVLARRDLAPRVRERLEMVKGAALGWDVATTAQWSGRSARTVERWLAVFRAGGAAALADAPRRGRPPKADAAYLAALEQAVEASPRDLGVAVDVWTSDRLSAYLAQTTGVTIAPGWLRALLARQRFACGRPKHSVAHLQDAAEVAACEARLAAAEKKSGPVSAPVRTPF
jgi:transposase